MRRRTTTERENTLRSLFRENQTISKWFLFADIRSTQTLISLYLLYCLYLLPISSRLVFPFLLFLFFSSYVNCFSFYRSNVVTGSADNTVKVSLFLSLFLFLSPLSLPLSLPLP